MPLRVIAYCPDCDKSDSHLCEVFLDPEIIGEIVASREWVEVKQDLDIKFLSTTARVLKEKRQKGLMIVCGNEFDLFIQHPLWQMAEEVRRERGMEV